MAAKDEINTMLDSLTGNFDTSQTDPPVTDEPVVTDPPVATDPPVDEVVTDPPDDVATEPPTTDEPVDDETDRIKRENEELRKKIEEMTAPKTKPPSTTAPTTDPPISDEDWLAGEDEIEEVDPRTLNKLLNKVYRKALETARAEVRKGSETTLRSIPDIVKSNVALQSELKKATEKFYEENADLKPFKKVVATVFEEITSENPDKSWKEILQKTGDEARSRLELHKKATDTKSTDKGNPPPLPRKKGSRVNPPKPKTEGIQGEIDAMNKTLR